MTIAVTTPRILRNAARCDRCGDVIESRHRHDFRACSCGALGVDGGLAYTRRSFSEHVPWTELTEYANPPAVPDRSREPGTSTAPTERRIVHCTLCNKAHAVLSNETPCAPGAWGTFTPETF